MGTWRLLKAGRLSRRALLCGALVFALAAVGSLESVLPRVGSPGTELEFAL